MWQNWARCNAEGATLTPRDDLIDSHRRGSHPTENRQIIPQGDESPTVRAPGASPVRFLLKALGGASVGSPGDAPFLFPRRIYGNPPGKPTTARDPFLQHS